MFCIDSEKRHGNKWANYASPQALFPGKIWKPGKLWQFVSITLTADTVSWRIWYRYKSDRQNWPNYSCIKNDSPSHRDDRFNTEDKAQFLFFPTSENPWGQKEGESSQTVQYKSKWKNSRSEISMDCFSYQQPPWDWSSRGGMARIMGPSAGGFAFFSFLLFPYWTSVSVAHMSRWLGLWCCCCSLSFVDKENMKL